MQKRWVKMVALVLAIIFLITSVGLVGYSVFSGI